MSPDIEWRVGDEADQETVVKTSRKQASRWRKLAVSLVVVLGVGLGVAYSSIPQPKPTTPPSPSPTPVPPPLADMIDREAQALADGDLKTFLSLQDQSDSRWYQSQSGSFQAWGRPYADFGSIVYLSNPLYTIVESGTLSSDRAWADVVQFRGGQYFRETRFYRLRGDQWFRARPDLSFWGEAQQFQTPHFDVAFRAGDEAVARVVADDFEGIYTRLCIGLRCPRDADGQVSRAISITLDFQPDVTQILITDDGPVVFMLPSLRLMGLYYQSLDVHGSNGLGNNAVLDRIATNGLIGAAARVASGVAQRTTSADGGTLFINAIVAWDYTRLRSGDTQSNTIDNLQAINDKPLLPLATLWRWQQRLFVSSSMLERMEIESSSIVVFIEQTYGVEGVLNFLRAIGPSDSIAEAIESGLNLKYADFEQQWQEWLKQFGVRVSP